MKKYFRALKRHIKAHTWRDVLLALVCLILIIGSLLLFWFSSLSIPDISLFQSRELPQSTKIYDSTGTVLLYDASGNARRTVVASSAISQNVKNATVAIEDTDFYNHGGIRIISIIRAILTDIIHGGAVQGGSTITQQVIKNSLLTNDKTIARKLKEWILSIKLEKVLSKDDILTMYLNEVPYGGNIYGVEEASKAFFGIDASQLDVAQAAYIAAIPQAPTYYSPYGSNTDALKARQELVLQKMESSGYITSDEYTQALNEQVTFLPNATQSIKAPHFVMYVLQYLEQKYGTDEVQNGGLSVITTLDYNLEAKMEADTENYIETEGPNFNMSNAAAVAINPDDGNILAMVGSYDYFSTTTDGNFNVATADNRQPGSTFKPIVYSEAFMKGYTPDTVLFDVPTEFDAGCSPEGTPLSSSVTQADCYMPQDFDGEYRGPMNLRDALAQSINIPSIELLYLAGLQDSLNLAKKMGITSLGDANEYGLTLVLGGGGVSLLEMTNAYGVFANDGNYTPYRSILKVTDSNGNVLEQADTPQSVSVMPANIARTISDILSDDQARAAEYGLHSTFDIDGYDVAAKTGTTNNTKDVWTIGYSPDVVVGVWGGNNDGTAMVKKIAGLIIAPLWHNLMSDALASTSDRSFIKPTPLTNATEKPVFRGIWQSGQSYVIDTVSGKLATQYTPTETQKEVSAGTNVHSILYWVDKNNPLGPAPTDPSNDPQFNNWETAARTWALANGMGEESPANIPTVTDDVHVPANFPVITTPGWNPNQTYNQTDTVTLPISVRSTYPITNITVYVNGAIVGTVPPNSSLIKFPIKNIYSLSATNSVKIEAIDSVYNRGDATVNLSVNTSVSSQ